jgi:Xaa-Pro dipeptidase
MPRENLMNVEEFERELSESGLDAVVAVSPANVFYTSGAAIPTLRSIPDRLAMTVLPIAGETILLTCAIGEKGVAAQTWIEDIRTYREFAQSPIHLLANVLREKGWAGGRIGIEKKYLTGEYYGELVEWLPDTRFEACDDLFDRVRSTKTGGEIERFRQAAVATERAVAEAFREATVGQTERQLLELVMANLAARGACEINTCILAAADQSGLVHPTARDRSLQRGDLVRVRVEAVFDGYPSGVSRMAVVGAASAAQKEMYDRGRTVQGTVIEGTRAGVRACDVFELCVRAWAKLGVEYRAPFVGHGVGLDGEEFPILQPENQAELRANMLISIEPLIVAENGEGYQFQDLVLVGEDGAKLLAGCSSVDDMLDIH